jgi:hypothetical protein
MRKLCLLGVALVMAGTAAAAPNVTNVTQKGSLLIWPDIRVDNVAGGTNLGGGSWNTLIRIQNDSNLAIHVKCYWMDGNKNRVDFVFVITREQPVWFDARTGAGSVNVNAFPAGNANGLDNPFLLGKRADADGTEGPAFPTGSDDEGPYDEGLLICFAIDSNGANQVRANHLSGTATVWRSEGGSYEYSAYAFFANNVAGEGLPVGTAGTLALNGATGTVDGYDACGLYQIGQFTPGSWLVGQNAGNAPPSPAPPAGVAPPIYGNRLAVALCGQDLRQDYVPVWTKLQFTVWNADEVGFTGAYECADSWHETSFGATGTVFNGGALDSAAQNFRPAVLKTYSARYRVQGVKSSQCEDLGLATQFAGVLAVQSTQIQTAKELVLEILCGFTCLNVDWTETTLRGLGLDWVATTLVNAGKDNANTIKWDRTTPAAGAAPGGTTPESGIR